MCVTRAALSLISTHNWKQLARRGNRREERRENREKGRKEERYVWAR